MWGLPGREDIRDRWVLNAREESVLPFKSSAQPGRRLSVGAVAKFDLQRAAEIFLRGAHHRAGQDAAERVFADEAALAVGARCIRLGDPTP